MISLKSKQTALFNLGESIASINPSGGAAAAQPQECKPVLGPMRSAIATAFTQTVYDPFNLQMRVIMLLDKWKDDERVRQIFYTLFGHPTTTPHPSLDEYRFECICRGAVDFIPLFYAYLHLHHLKCASSTPYREKMEGKRSWNDRFLDPLSEAERSLVSQIDLLLVCLTQALRTNNAGEIKKCAAYLTEAGKKKEIKWHKGWSDYEAKRVFRENARFLIQQNNLDAIQTLWPLYHSYDCEMMFPEEAMALDNEEVFDSLKSYAEKTQKDDISYFRSVGSFLSYYAVRHPKYLGKLIACCDHHSLRGALREAAHVNAQSYRLLRSKLKPTGDPPSGSDGGSSPIFSEGDLRELGGLLRVAAREGKTELVAVLKEDCDPGTIKDVFIQAASSGQAAVIEELLQGSSYAVVSEVLSQALTEAMINKHESALQKLFPLCTLENWLSVAEYLLKSADAPWLTIDTETRILNELLKASESEQNERISEVIRNVFIRGAVGNQDGILAEILRSEKQDALLQKVQPYSTHSALAQGLCIAAKNGGLEAVKVILSSELGRKHLSAKDCQSAVDQVWLGHQEEVERSIQSVDYEPLDYPSEFSKGRIQILFSICKFAPLHPTFWLSAIYSWVVATLEDIFFKLLSSFIWCLSRF